MIRVPTSHVAYACERSLVCCQAPTRAPCHDEDLAAMRPVLERTEAGRSLFPIIAARREAVPTTAGDTVVFEQVDGRCVHLDLETPSCHIHAQSGLDALSLACRNFPRLVTQLGDAVEVAFNLSCPTAARLLVENAGPIGFSDVAATSFPFPVSRVAAERVAVLPGDSENNLDRDGMLALRAAWWRILATDRDDPARLVSRASYLHFSPEDPPDGPADIDPRIVHETFLEGLTGLEAHLFARGFERIPERAQVYLAHRWPVTREVMGPITSKELRLAASVMAPALHAFLDHQVLLAGVHDGRAVGPFLRNAARRAIGIVRHVDAMCHRVPFSRSQLIADAISASMLVEPLAPSPTPMPEENEDLSGGP